MRYLVLVLFFEKVLINEKFLCLIRRNEIRIRFYFLLLELFDGSIFCGDGECVVIGVGVFDFVGF